MTVKEHFEKLEKDLARMKLNREKVPLAELQTRYAKAYNTLVAELEYDADWFCTEYINALMFPKDPNDTEGNAQVEQRIAAILQEEKSPGGRVEQYRKALAIDLDRKRFEQLVWEIYDRLEREAFMPYWNAHCRWVGPPGNRWIFNDIFKKFWYGPERRGEGKSGFWITADYKGEDLRYPPQIGDDPG